MRLRLVTIGFLLVHELYLLHSRDWPLFKVRELLLNGFFLFWGISKKLQLYS